MKWCVGVCTEDMGDMLSRGLELNGSQPWIVKRICISDLFGRMLTNNWK